MADLQSESMQLANGEPALMDLLTDIQRLAAQTGGDERFCANEAWYREPHRPGQVSFKDRLAQLVGWKASKPALATSRAYDVACGYLYSQLPNCRKCGCL